MGHKLHAARTLAIVTEAAYIIYYFHISYMFHMDFVVVVSISKELSWFPRLMVAYPGNPGSIRVASPPPEPARLEPEFGDKDCLKFWSEEKQGGRQTCQVNLKGFMQS